MKNTKMAHCAPESLSLLSSGAQAHLGELMHVGSAGDHQEDRRQDSTQSDTTSDEPLAQAGHEVNHVEPGLIMML